VTRLLRVAGVVVGTAVALAAVLHGRVLAIGDGLIESVPAFFAPYVRWQPDMFAGFPIFADPNKAYWYPLRLLNMVPDGFNFYVLAPYTIAGGATFAYVRNLTGSSFAGSAGACAFTFGGFMVSHLGHPMLIEPACWFCVAMWALDSYLRTRGAAWLAGVSASVLISLTAGQPQVAAFAIALLVSYLLIVGISSSLRSTAAVFFEGLCAVVLGAAGAAFAWLPTISLTTRSVRSGLDFASYVHFSLPPERIALLLVYPFTVGGGAQDIYHGPIVDGVNFDETAIYVPFAALVLATLAPFSGRIRIAFFWASVALAGIVLAVGDALPLAALTYQALPGFNLFRIPGRHAFEFTFALAVLAGLGVAATGRRVPRIAVGGAGLVAIAIAAAATSTLLMLRPDAPSRPSMFVFAAAIGGQLALCLVALLSPMDAARRRAFACAAIAGGAALFALTSYACDAPSADVLTSPAYVRFVKRLPLQTGQRIYTEGSASRPELQPNLPQVWGVPEIGGYTPLQYARSRIYLQTGEDGRLLNVESPLLDVAAVRYFVTPADEGAASRAVSNPFSDNDLGIFLSVGAPNAPRSITLGLPQMRTATRLAIVTSLGGSAAVRQGAIVATLVLRSRSGHVQKALLRAGKETAELAYDRPDVLAIVRHKRAAIFERNGELSWYRFDLPVDFREPVAAVSFRAVDPEAALNLRKVSLLDDAGGRAYPFSASAKYYGDPTRFRHIADIGEVSIFENLRANPPAWIARAVSVPLDQASEESESASRETISRLDLRREASTQNIKTESDTTSRAALLSDGPERRAVSASCRQPCFLVNSMTFSDDWKAEIDGRPAELTPADGIFQGVLLPAGEHTVSFRYEPASGRNGLMISAAALSALLLVTWKAKKRRARIVQGYNKAVVS
jgi:hypothetical protein